MKTEAEQQTEPKVDDLEDEEKKPCERCSKETDANDGKTDAAAAAATAAKCLCRRESSASSEDSVLSNKVGSVNVTPQFPWRSRWRTRLNACFPRLS